MATSRAAARSFRGTNDFFTATLDCKETVETLKQCRPVKTDNDSHSAFSSLADRELKIVLFSSGVVSTPTLYNLFKNCAQLQQPTFV